MTPSTRIPEHMQRIGAMVVNLQSLEFALRAFLHNCQIGWKNRGGPSFLDDIAEGQEVEENAFTNYDQLKDLIMKYNCQVESKDADLKVNPDIVRIRDALAHGRKS